MGIFKKKYTIGLDIGSSTVKMAAFTEDEKGMHFVKADMRELAKPAEGAFGDDEIVSALKDLLKGIGLKNSKVIAAVNSPEATIKKITTPYMPKSELRKGIELQARSYFPFPIEEALLDFEILGDIAEKGARKEVVLAAAIPSKTVKKYLALLDKAGIRPYTLIPASYALQKIAGKQLAKDGDASCLIDIGKTYTEVVIMLGKELMFARKIPLAGSDFTNAMTGTLVSDRGTTQLTMAEAEKIKREVGIPSDTESRLIDDKISTTQVLSMLRAPMDQLSADIARSFDYYREEAGSGRIGSVTLFGGGAFLSGLTKFLSDELEMDVRIGDPSRDMEMAKGALRDPEKTAHLYEIAMGAALSGVKGLNLLPEEIKGGTKRVIRRSTIEAAAAAVILMLAFTYTGMRIQLGNFRTKISTAEMELASLRTQLDRAEAQAIAERILSEEAEWEDLFKELSNVIPDNIHMTHFSMKDDMITMKGVVGSRNGEQALAAFILTLERGIFNNVKLVETKELPDKSGIAFEIRCWVDYEDS